MNDDSEFLKDIAKLEIRTDELNQLDLEDAEIDTDQLESLLMIIGRTILSLLK